MATILLKPVDPCSTCVGWNWGKTGYVPASGTGENGVLVVAEAGGEHEAIEGMPLVGKAGHYLWQQLARVGIEREGFRCHNALSCRPPNNKLSKQPYEDAVIAHCSPLLDATISDMRQKCRENGRTFVIVTLGQIAFRRILGLNQKDALLREDYLCYPIYSERYQAWVLAVDHPSYLMRGNNHLVPVLQYGFKRALEIAETGLTLDTHDYLLDPAPATFAGWVRDYLVQLDHDRDNTFLSYDIETPYKQGKSEGELANEESDDYQILRVSFAYRPNEAVSVPWQADYLPYLEELFASGGKKVGWNSAGYDDPRIMARVPINGDRLDGMLCWHVLNSALDKSLGFVTPFYVKTTGMWKHLADSQPAFYNAKDADMALRNFLGIKADLERANLWPVYERHVVQLNRALTYMSGKGVLRDEVMRSGAEKQLSDLLDVTELQMEAAVPIAARRMKVYKKQPKVVTQEMVCEEKSYPVDACTSCGLLKPGRWKRHSVLCSGKDVVSLPMPQKVWLQPLEFKVSKLGLTNYQRAMCHQAVTDRRTQKVTFDESAIMKLMKTHPADLLYPLILKFRHYQKLLTTYVGITQPDGRIRGGMTTGSDGVIRCMYTHNPSTLRLACQNPNMQQLPRG